MLSQAVLNVVCDPNIPTSFPISQDVYRILNRRWIHRRQTRKENEQSSLVGLCSQEIGCGDRI